MKRYPQKRSAAIPALWAVQRRYGWCTPGGHPPGRRGDGRDARLPASRSRASTTSSASSPQGEHQVLVCTNISCWLRGADELLEAFGEAAGVDGQGSSEDGKVFVRGFECLGACDIAPMASIDERYYGPLEPRTTPRPRSSSCASRRGGAARRSGSRTAAPPAARAAPADKRISRAPGQQGEAEASRRRRADGR